MFNFLISEELNQINIFKNIQNRLLDLVFASENGKMTCLECNNPMVPVDMFHKPFKISITCHTYK